MNGIFGSWFASHLRLREEGSVSYHGSLELSYAKVQHVMSSNMVASVVRTLGIKTVSFFYNLSLKLFKGSFLS